MVFISRAYTRIAPESQAALLPAQSLDRRGTAKLGSARTAAATSDRASLPPGRPSGRRDALDGLWFGAMQIFDANYLAEIRTWSYVILIRRMEPPRARLAGRTDWRTAFVLLRLAWRKKFLF